MKIGLDIDGVLCNFPQGVIDHARKIGLENEFPTDWREVDHWGIAPKAMSLMDNLWTSVDFWLKLAPLPYALPLDFTPDCYITARRIDSWVTEQWLSTWRFPQTPVFTVKDPLAKVKYIKERNLDLFVDDHWETVENLIQQGINAVLYSAPYQRGHKTDHLPTIKHLSELRTYGQNRITRTA